MFTHKDGGHSGEEYLKNGRFEVKQVNQIPGHESLGLRGAIKRNQYGDGAREKGAIPFHNI